MVTAVETTSPSALAAPINTEHEAADRAVHAGLQHALNCGRLLIEAKAQLRHGQWLPFVKEYLPFSERSARGYIGTLRRWEALPEAKRQRVADLSYRDALKVLAGRDVHMSSESSEWYSSPRIISRVVKALGRIDLDPCSNSHDEPVVPAGTHFTKEDDGLDRPWFGSVYMNPPYGHEIGDWVTYLCEQFERGVVDEAAALLPARTDTDWFRRLRRYPKCFVWGRLKFSGHKNAAPFPSMVAYFGKDMTAFAKSFGDMGDIHAIVDHWGRKAVNA